jgi:hypothetical protein
MYRFLHRSFPQKSAGVQCAMRISTEPFNSNLCQRSEISLGTNILHKRQKITINGRNNSKLKKDTLELTNFERW